MENTGILSYLKVEKVHSLICNKTSAAQNQEYVNSQESARTHTHTALFQKVTLKPKIETHKTQVLDIVSMYQEQISNILKH